ncbi:MAG TPA: hypothetical protein VG389_03425 [Myxococcota bacterium]|jgi:hypothetical protein|nr:hypothetical protein [Myxococcota bacterium]
MAPLAYGLGLGFVSLLAFAPGCHCGNGGASGEVCGNGVDDDGDGTVDCIDPECRDLDPCQNVPEACFNGLDDDFDGAVDCVDSDCAAAPGCNEDCANGVDDNGDGLVDCDDSVCRGVDPACGEVCGNGEDDDSDGDVDCADADCADVIPPCGAGGADGTVCSYDGTPDTCQCADGADNDGDGNIDVNDIHCFSPIDDDESSFATGIPGDNNGAMGQIECPFDGNSGIGNDAVCCNLADPSMNVTPNGCDNTGCCEIDANGNGTGEHVRIAGTCEYAPACGSGAGSEGCACTAAGGECDTGQNCVLDDDVGDGFCSLCAPCTTNAECDNTCACGEACFGGFVQPTSECGGTTMTCPTGVTECPTGTECDAANNEVCTNGCCFQTCPTGVTPCTVSSDCAANSGFICVTGCCVLLQ